MPTQTWSWVGLAKSPPSVLSLHTLKVAFRLEKWLHSLGKCFLSSDSKTWGQVLNPSIHLGSASLPYRVEHLFSLHVSRTATFPASGLSLSQSL